MSKLYKTVNLVLFAKNWIAESLFLCIAVGAPIDLEKDSNPSNEKIDEYHKRYMTELSALFDEHKVKYGVPEETKLVFV